MKLGIHAIDQLETDFLIAKNTAISSVAKTINKLRIQSDLHLIYKKTSMMIKKEIYEMFLEYLVLIIDNLDHFALIEEFKQNLDSASYKKFKPRFKATIKEEINDRNDKIDYRPTRIKEGINWLSLSDIMEFTADSIENEKIILPLLLKMFSMIHIRC